MKQLTAQRAIANLMEVFARYGLVEVLASNGGPPFIAERFKEFMIINSIKHIISPTGYPSTNGQAENIIKTVKAISASKQTSKKVRPNKQILTSMK
jgi:transposase InsO family protein